MTAFFFTPLVNDPPATVLSAALGVDASNPLAQADVGKVVKLAASNNYVLAATGDDIEGIVSTIAAEGTVNDGFSFGGVQVDRRILAEVAAAQGGAIAIGAFVVAGIQIARGTAGIAQVIAGAGANHKWRVIRHVTGTGVAGNTVLLEKV